jgi:NAD(P)-dependent dehydrogenase (short-subunit alcohol dehydrogenase family)
VKIRLKPLRDQVVVITGASSGIGLTTAREAARRGARVVVSARSEDALRRLTEEINAWGGQAVYVVADVTKVNDLQRLADTAIQRFGGFDTWVNNAGASIFGRISDVPIEDERRLFEVNYWSVVYGSRLAVDHLRRRGGALINMGTVAADRSIPLQAASGRQGHAKSRISATRRVA